jgi:hypothetical protein|tara:strand:- start:7310 stop:7582 length:273 start_codon:yes stop_codon:yes gene_type:complete
MKYIPWLRRVFIITASLIVTTVMFYHIVGHAKSKRTRFYDFSDQLIDGKLKKPSTLFLDSRSRAKFSKLLKLKKSFREQLILSSKDPLLR